MRVYVKNMRGEPLMPTTPSKARALLKNGKATVLQRTPFAIQLSYPTGETRQPITLGIDAGSKVIGLSASTEKEELFSAEVLLRTEVTDLLSSRRAFRRARRGRKTRYRKARFLNRKRGKGWLAPSVRNKVEAHRKAVEQIHRILPISKIVVEVASFDIQKIRNPDISGEGYQQGNQLGFWNVREYVLFRDGHTCQHCKGKNKDKVLNVHHIESRKVGGDAPNNLITLCETCHKKYHAGEIELTARRGLSFRDAAFMGIMRWAFYDILKLLYPSVRLTYGYITKNTRIHAGLEKSHRTDAYCIAGNIGAIRATEWFLYKQVRGQNRQLHKATISKGGYRKANKAPRLVYGFHLFDKVEYNGKGCFIFGRRTSGSFDLRLLDGTKITAGVSCKKLRLLETAGTLLTERRAASSPCLKAGVFAA